MSLLFPLIGVFGGALVWSLFATPVANRLATAVGLVDRPDDHRKLHTGAIPLAGGLVILAAVCMAFLVAIVAYGRGEISPNDFYFASLLFVAAVAIAIVGVMDDRFALRGRQKLLGQVFAASIVAFGGVSIDQISFAGASWPLGVFAKPATVLWIVAAINAINLVDGCDGFASAIGLVASVVLAILLASIGRVVECVAAVTLAGALAGFLWHNAPPARTFLGDSGSMLVGLALGTLAIRGSFKEATALMLVVPASVLAIPLLDVAMAIVRRRLTGRSIFSTDRRHLHHSMQEYGLDSRSMVVLVAFLSAATGAGALTSVWMSAEWPAVGCVLLVAVGLAGLRIFGHHEFSLIADHGKRFAVSFVSRGSRPAESVAVRLQGRRDWEPMWEAATGFADKMGIHTMQLNVALPAMGEEFHSSWSRGGARVHDAEVWVVEFPLHHRGRAVGRLRLVGESPGDNVSGRLSELIADFHMFEKSFEDVLLAGESPQQDESLQQETPTTVHDAEMIPTVSVRQIEGSRAGAS